MQLSEYAPSPSTTLGKKLLGNIRVGIALAAAAVVGGETPHAEAQVNPPIVEPNFAPVPHWEMIGHNSLEEALHIYTGKGNDWFVHAELIRSAVKDGEDLSNPKLNNLACERLEDAIEYYDEKYNDEMALTRQEYMSILVTLNPSRAADYCIKNLGHWNTGVHAVAALVVEPYLTTDSDGNHISHLPEEYLVEIAAKGNGRFQQNLAVRLQSRYVSVKHDEAFKDNYIQDFLLAAQATDRDELYGKCREIGTSGLAFIGDSAVDELQKILETGESSQERVFAAQALGKIGQSSTKNIGDVLIDGLLHPEDTATTISIGLEYFDLPAGQQSESGKTRLKTYILTALFSETMQEREQKMLLMLLELCGNAQEEDPFGDFIEKAIRKRAEDEESVPVP